MLVIQTLLTLYLADLKSKAIHLT